MKTMKRFFALAIAAAIVMAMSVTSFAATTADGSITIDNASKGAVYNIYRIFDLESYTKDKAYAYKVNEAWTTFANQGTVKGVYIDIDTNGYVTWHEGADAQAFAKLAQAYAAAEKINPVKTITAEDSPVKFTGLELGYYLVDTSLGSLCSLNTTDKEVTIKDKNEVPSIDKKVKEDKDGAWYENNDAEIGQTVEYKAVITVPNNTLLADGTAGAQGYVMHDKMSAGLTYRAVSKIELTSGSTTTVAAEKYTVKTSELSDDCTFEVQFHQDFLDTLKPGDTITVYYSAVLNDNAVIAGAGNPNEVYLKYGESSQFETAHAKTVTYTWQADFLKYTNVKDSENHEFTAPLAGAEFELYTQPSSQGGRTALRFHKSDNTYKVCTDADCVTASVSKITTDGTGKFSVTGLDEGTYYLHESKAPDGYNVLAADKEITITSTAKTQDSSTSITASVPHETIAKFEATGEWTDSSASVTAIGVLNQTGSELPSTGGMGTTIFYMVGGAMMLCAAVLLVTKKKMSVSEN